MVLIVILIALITLSLYNYRVAKKTIIMSLVVLNLIFLYRGGRKTIEYSKQESYELTDNNYYTYCLNVGNKALVDKTDVS